MSTDAILDLTAAVVVFGSFWIVNNWEPVRKAILRTAGAEEDPVTTRPLNRS